MTLKEIFIKPTKKYSSLFGWSIDLESAEECVEIADNHAIEFAEWIQDEEYNMRWFIEQEKTKELIDVFKKEKGL